MEITCEVQVHVFHWDNLRVTAPRSPTFHAEVRAQRRFANTNHRVLADVV